MGLRSLVDPSGRGGVVYVPPRYTPGQPTALLLLLHGAGGAGANVVRPFIPLADSSTTIVVAPDSRGPTWDFIRGPFGPDVAFIDDLLRQTFDAYDIDPERVAVAGFSDGASYALSLGLTNGDLFTRVVALSPGTGVVFAPVGRPRVFIAHGTEDRVLPIDRTSRRIVPSLREQGYLVEYREFSGQHRIVPEIVSGAFRWLWLDG
jgi:phospholipase/carboxylesterase